MAAKPKIASNLLHLSNYIDVLKTLNSQEKIYIFEIVMHIKQQISSKPFCLLKGTKGGSV